MSVDENKALVQRYFDTIWNAGQLEREPEFVAQDIVIHAPPMPGLPDGIGGPLEIVGAFRAALPDLKLTNDLLFGEDDKVVQKWTCTGTHSGKDLFGVPPGGMPLTITGINCFRVADGHIAERWGSIDVLGMLQQLGVVPTPGQAPPA